MILKKYWKNWWEYQIILSLGIFWISQGFPISYRLIWYEESPGINSLNGS